MTSVECVSFLLAVIHALSAANLDKMFNETKVEGWPSQTYPQPKVSLDLRIPSVTGSDAMECGGRTVGEVEHHTGAPAGMANAR